jgi:type III restriction enzyme
VHDINVLTVVASESYKGFVAALQKEIVENLSTRPRQADAEYFARKTLKTEDQELVLDKALAKKLERFLIKNDFVDEDGHITAAYHEARKAHAIEVLPEELEPHREAVLALIDTVFNGRAVEDMFSDGRKQKKNPLNDNFHRKEFQELWRRINRKAVYQVEFESAALVRSCIDRLERDLRVTPLQYLVTEGALEDAVTDDRLRAGEAFVQGKVRTETGKSAHSRVSYDVIGTIAENTDLTRKTVGDILTGIQAAKFGEFAKNPEQFIADASHLIQEQKAIAVIERLTYDATEDRYNAELFAAGQWVDVIGTSKGHGFSGVVKRYKFGGLRMTHGSMMHRRTGAIGCRSTPGRVWKNQKMPGQDGNKQRTVQNLKVVAVRPEDGVLLISGAIPGAKGSYVTVRPAKKKSA